ncbi:MAG TPA: UDP-N-acetylmuramoyl-L-alanyl-D-glutamate--2,6-diaminopimelate ligase [Xanthomonadaceae bacterium]|nr:UDP-N-acetylmuramoyl-L-alanyl-D-glutamate--2,6-diaminopimelate ligase [Xanthomonadaceae bacterium]
MRPGMRLSELLDGHARVSPTQDAVVHGLTQDSRQVSRGDAFVALRGASTHGLRHADAAMAAGAAAIVFEPPAPGQVIPPSRSVAVDGLRTRLGAIADRFFQAPSAALRVIGVTGTNGKTSTVQLIAQALSAAGRSAGTIGTLGAGLHGHERPLERTTPDVISVHGLLADMRAQGAGDVAMEVSSHALEQGRVDGVRFSVAAFTNLTHEHLDYHGSLEAYGTAKARLFAWPALGAAVINLDDAFGAQLLARLPSGVRAIGYSAGGRAHAAVRAASLAPTAEGIGFELLIEDRRAHVDSALLGRFNVENLLAVAGVLWALDWSLEDIASALAALRPVPGRMNRVGGGSLPLVVVDYAHTPDALEQALHTLREHCRGRVLCVFGCGGRRDRGKRPQMGAIAERLADRVIVTDDNPREEDGDAIVVEILAGLSRPEAVAVVRDRESAIAQALTEAVAGDIVLVAGKGHERYQERGGQRIPFDDAAVARRVLEQRP